MRRFEVARSHGMAFYAAVKARRTMEKVGFAPLSLFVRSVHVNKEEMLIAELEPLAAAHGLDLVTVEVAGTRKAPILRVFLDTLAGGITLDELVEAQEWVDARVEAIDPFLGSYDLEVSSPGIDRPLRKRSDFERFAGERTVVHLKAGGPRSKFTGISHGLEADELVLEMEDGSMERLPLDGIKKANIIGQIDFSGHNFEEDLESDN